MIESLLSERELNDIRVRAQHTARNTLSKNIVMNAWWVVIKLERLGIEKDDIRAWGDAMVAAEKARLEGKGIVTSRITPSPYVIENKPFIRTDKTNAVRVGLYQLDTRGVPEKTNHPSTEKKDDDL